MWLGLNWLIEEIIFYYVIKFETWSTSKLNCIYNLGRIEKMRKYEEKQIDQMKRKTWQD